MRTHIIITSGLIPILNSVVPNMIAYRLTKKHLPRQFFSTLKAASLLGVIGSGMASLYAVSSTRRG